MLKIFLVEETLRARRNSVVISSRDGKMENSSASLIFMLISRIMIARDIFNIIITSIKNGLNGTIKSSTMATTASETAL